MKVVFYGSKQYEKSIYKKLTPDTITLDFVSERLSADTVMLSQGASAICCFVSDDLSSDILQQLHQYGIQLITLRSAGYDHIDLKSAKKIGLQVCNAPGYSPNAIAEFATGLLLNLTRKISLGNERVKRHNFSLEGLMGYNLASCTVGIIGMGSIGTIFSEIMRGFGCRVIAYDPSPNLELVSRSVEFKSLNDVFKQSDVISLHCPLNDKTHHLLDTNTINHMKDGAILINTSRGAIIKTTDLFPALDSGRIAGLGLDVYEYEREIFFRDLSNMEWKDKLFDRLEQYDNVIITGHQAFLSKEAVTAIAKTTLSNIQSFMAGSLSNAL